LVDAQPSRDGPRVLLSLQQEEIMPRNYKKEYENYQGAPDQIKKRASRNSARRIMEKKGKVAKGDGKDVDHKNGSALDNNHKNLRTLPKTQNRSFPRTKTARKKV
jgi:hypothetical protein